MDKKKKKPKTESPQHYKNWNKDEYLKDLEEDQDDRRNRRN